MTYHVTMTTKDQRTPGKMCRPYKFLILKGGSSFIAFEYGHSFRRWMRERGLKIGQRNGRHGEIIGDYKTVYKDLDASPIDGGIKTMTLHNGDYVTCVIKDGIEYVDHKGYYRQRQDIEDYRRLQKIYG